MKHKLDSIPVWFIQAEIDRQLLETTIAMSEGDDEAAAEWLIRQSALEKLLLKWITEGENHD